MKRTRSRRVVSAALAACAGDPLRAAGGAGGDAIHAERRHAARRRGRRARRPGAAVRGRPATSRRNGGRCSSRPRSTPWCARRWSAARRWRGRSARLRQAQEDCSARSGATRCPRVDAKLSANRVDVDPQSLGVQSLPLDDAVQPLSRLGGRVVHVRSLRRDAARAGGAAGRGRLPALRARGGAPDARRQRRHRGDPRGVAARADRDAARRSSPCRRASSRSSSACEQLGTAAQTDVVAQRLRARAGARRSARAAAPARAGAPPPGRLHRPAARRRAAARVPPGRAATAGRAAAEPALGARAPAAGHPRRRGAAAAGRRARRRGHREPVPADHALGHRRLARLEQRRRPVRAAAAASTCSARR